jgi:hypothetical protein
MAAKSSSSTHNSIEVPDLPSVEHKSDYFRNGYLAMIVAGASGCGKSRLLASILPMVSDKVETVIIATIIRDAPVHLAIIEYFKRKGAFAAIERDLPTLYKFVDTARELGQVNHETPGLMIFDDFAVKPGGTGPHWEFVIYAASKLRNHGWSIITVTQRPTFIPTIVRDCSNARVLFTCYTRSAIESFCRDVSDRVADPNILKILVDYINSHHYHYLYIREFPLEVCLGQGTKLRPVLRERSVIFPTYNEVLREMGIDPSLSPAVARKLLKEKSSAAQIQAGNTAPQLQDDLPERTTKPGAPSVLEAGGDRGV